MSVTRIKNALNTKRLPPKKNIKPNKGDILSVFQYCTGLNLVQNNTVDIYNQSALFKKLKDDEYFDSVYAKIVSLDKLSRNSNYNNDVKSKAVLLVTILYHEIFRSKRTEYMYILQYYENFEDKIRVFELIISQLIQGFLSLLHTNVLVVEKFDQTVIFKRWLYTLQNIFNIIGLYISDSKVVSLLCCVRYLAYTLSSDFYTMFAQPVAYVLLERILRLPVSFINKLSIEQSISMLDIVKNVYKHVHNDDIVAFFNTIPKHYIFHINWSELSLYSLIQHNMFPLHQPTEFVVWALSEYYSNTANNNISLLRNVVYILAVLKQSDLLLSVNLTYFSSQSMFLSLQSRLLVYSQCSKFSLVGQFRPDVEDIFGVTDQYIGILRSNMTALHIHKTLEDCYNTFIVSLPLRLSTVPAVIDSIEYNTIILDMPGVHVMCEPCIDEPLCTVLSVFVTKHDYTLHASIVSPENGVFTTTIDNSITSLSQEEKNKIILNILNNPTKSILKKYNVVPVETKVFFQTIKIRGNVNLYIRAKKIFGDIANLNNVELAAEYIQLNSVEYCNKLLISAKYYFPPNADKVSNVEQTFISHPIEKYLKEYSYISQNDILFPTCF